MGGRCDLIEEIMIGEDKLIRFSGCPNSQASSIVIRGANTHVVDEAHRSLHDALCVLSQTVKSTSVLPGGGDTEMLMAQAVEEASKTVSGKQVLAMEAYAKALRAMPMHIADNAGYDSAELVSGLRAKHYEGHHTWGLEMNAGGLADMNEMGICESLQMKMQVLLSASEAAEMILRVDDMLKPFPSSGHLASSVCVRTLGIWVGEAVALPIECVREERYPCRMPHFRRVLS